MVGKISSKRAIMIVDRKNMSPKARISKKSEKKADELTELIIRDYGKTIKKLAKN